MLIRNLQSKNGMKIYCSTFDYVYGEKFLQYCTGYAFADAYVNRMRCKLPPLQSVMVAITILYRYFVEATGHIYSECQV